jgi:hypothetical protein
MSGSIPPGNHYSYDFVVSPPDINYHCHVSPIQSHIRR